MYFIKMYFLHLQFLQTHYFHISFFELNSQIKKCLFYLLNFNFRKTYLIAYIILFFKNLILLGRNVFLNILSSKKLKYFGIVIFII